MARDLERGVATPPVFKPGARRRRGFNSRGVISALAVFVAIGAGVGLGLRLVDRVGNAPSYPLAGKVQPPPRGETYWGIYRSGAPADRTKLLSLEQEVGRDPAIVMWYEEWEGESSFPASEAGWLYDRGMVPMITWEPWEVRTGPNEEVVDQPKYRLSNIVRGEFDDYIRTYAESLHRYGGPVMLRPFHEMDGNWYPWGGTVNGNSPADELAAWRHVHDLFEEVGATNVTWVWSVNFYSVPTTADNTIDRYWPGWTYVDWVGISGFNRGATSPRVAWRSFEDVNGDRYRELVRYGKPVAVTETGAPELGGDKASWISDTFENLPTAFPRLAALVWYDTRETNPEDWRIESSQASLRAFKDAVALPHVLSARAAQETATEA